MCYNENAYLVGHQSPVHLAFYRVLHLRVAKAVQDGEENALEKEEKKHSKFTETS